MPWSTRLIPLVALSLAVSAWGTPGKAAAQSPPPGNPALIDAVTRDPATAPQLTAQEVAAGEPDGAAPIVSEVVGALPASQRLLLAPRVVSAAIAALIASQRVPQAPAIACAAVRAVPAAERSAVVPAIVAAAVAMAPSARLQIVACATEALPELASPPTSPLPGSTIGRDVLFNAVSQTCASAPCP